MEYWQYLKKEAAVSEFHLFKPSIHFRNEIRK